MIFQTERLIIRNYRDSDRAIFAAIAAAPAVRLYHTRVVSQADTDAFIDRQIENIRHKGCGFAVVERKADGDVLGDVGIRYMAAGQPVHGPPHPARMTRVLPAWGRYRNGNP